RLPRHDGHRRPGNGAGDGRSPHRSAHPRRHAARRGRVEPVPQGTGGITDADHHAHRPRRGCRPHRRAGDGRRRLSAKALQPARAAGADQRRAAPADRGPARERDRRRRRAHLRRLAHRSSPARIAQSGRRARGDDQRRIRSAADLLRARRPRAVARQPARLHARAQRRLVRALHRRAGQPHPPQDRARSAERDHDQDGALRRLFVYPKRARISLRQPLTMKLPGFLNLKGIGGQIAALVVASIIALHVIITAAFLINRPDRGEPFAVGGPHELALAAQLLAAAPPAERARLLADLARAYPQLELESLPADIQPAATEIDHAVVHGLIRHLGSHYRVFTLPPHPHRVGITLPDGAMIAATIPIPRRPPPFWGGPWMMTAMFAVISVTLLGLWAARALTAPLSAFARAAESFSLNSTDAPLPERGPEEIRAVARALNRMRARITALI